jgi:para-nitrobenzyl esterase
VTELGGIAGSWVNDQIAQFAGIRYAEDTGGNNRFRPPVPVQGWDGVYDASEFGPICPQNASLLDSVFGQMNPTHSEDCLRLNVWSGGFDSDGSLAGGADAALRPVLVWIHGGGFEMGASSQELYLGDRLAESGLVVVSFNYRLGTLGFMELGQLDPAFAGSGNNGLRDQLCALRWIQNNIAAFGGDPEQVTLFGQSAGSMSIAFLMASGQLVGLANRVVCQSGAASLPAPVSVAQLSTDSVVAGLGATSVEDLQKAAVADLLNQHAQIGLQRIGNPEMTLESVGDPAGFLPFRPVADGEFLPLSPLEAIASGAAQGIDLVIGVTEDEWSLFGMMDPSGSDLGHLRERIELLGGDSDEVIDYYRLALGGPTASAEAVEDAAFVKSLTDRVMTDIVFTRPAVDLAAAQGAWATVWLFEFTWDSPAMGGILGATHGVELPFQFRKTAMPTVAMFIGDAPPDSLTKSMSGLTVAFALSGDPGTVDGVTWTSFDPANPVHLRIDETCELREGPDSARLGLWSGAYAGGVLAPTRRSEPATQASAI